MKYDFRFVKYQGCGNDGGAMPCRRFYLSRMSLFRGFLQGTPSKALISFPSTKIVTTLPLFNDPKIG
jgi:hypothetical protein